MPRLCGSRKTRAKIKERSPFAHTSIYNAAYLNVVNPVRGHIEHLPLAQDRLRCPCVPEVRVLLEVGVAPIDLRMAARGMRLRKQVYVLALVGRHQDVSLRTLEHSDHVPPSIEVRLGQNTAHAKAAVDATIGCRFNNEEALIPVKQFQVSAAATMM